VSKKLGRTPTASLLDIIWFPLTIAMWKVRIIIECIEIMGYQGFVKFNDLIISLSGPKETAKQQQLIEIGRTGRLTISYDGASRPPLKKAP
jgi:hypothetical protein